MLLLESTDLKTSFQGFISYEGLADFQRYQGFSFDYVLPDAEIQTISAQIIEPNPDEYLRAIKQCQQYIAEGDIYQANISRKYIIKLENPYQPAPIYKALTAKNPGRYGGFMRGIRYDILSVSPEIFLKIDHEGEDVILRSYPIKGTAQEDLELDSSKNHAEHIMIVDLERNDLSRICDDVRVTNLMQAEKYNNLKHYVSCIEGKLKKKYILDQGLDFKAIFQACYPGGSITGAPKERSMEIIHELEPCCRGPYTGSMGYYTWGKSGVFNILIRTLVYDKLHNELSLHVGAGITAYSDPESELEETRIKACKLLEIFHA